MGRHDPAGHPVGPEGYVFGDEVGHRLTSQQKAWETAVLKAHSTPLPGYGTGSAWIHWRRTVR